MTIIFLFIFLCANTELHELFKLPVLIHHYLEHKHFDHNASFTDFLNEHYNSKQTHADNSNHDHKKLPLKSHSESLGIAILSFLPVNTNFVVKPIYSETKKHIILKENFIPSFVLSTIWQPPKSC